MQQLRHVHDAAMTATRITRLAADVVGGRADHAEHDELRRVGAISSGRRTLIAVHPPDERGDDGGVRVLRQQLVGVRQQHRRGGDDGDGTARATSRPARRRTIPWASTSHTQNAATSSSFNRS